jgi:hypothetical protein
MKRLAGTLLLLSLLVLNPVEAGIGMQWFTVEATTTEGERLCIKYGLYNPFDTAVQGFLDVSGDLVKLTPYARPYLKNQELEKKQKELREVYRDINSEIKQTTDRDQLARLRDELGTVDEQLRQIEEKIRENNKEIDRLKVVDPVELPARVYHNASVKTDLCFDTPDIGSYRIDNKYLGKHFLEDCKTKFYSGEVQAKYTTDDAVSGTGSAVMASVSAPLTVKVRCKPDTTPVKEAMIIAVLLAVAAGLIIRKRRRKDV